MLVEQRPHAPEHHLVDIWNLAQRLPHLVLEAVHFECVTVLARRAAI